MSTVKRALATFAFAAAITVSGPAVASAAPAVLPAHPEPGHCRVLLTDAIWDIPQNWNCKVRSAGYAFLYLAHPR